MKSEIKIQHPAVATHLPEHEQAARKRRAALVGIAPPPKPPKPPARPIGARKTWHVAWPDPSGKDKGKRDFQTHPAATPHPNHETLTT